MSSNVSNKEIRACRIILGGILPMFTILIGLGTFLTFYSELPNMVTVHFDITRVPTTSVSKLTFGLLMSILLVLSATVCTLTAISKRSFSGNRYLTIVSYAGFFSAISASLMVGSVIIHRGLSNWQDATGPGWWLLAVILIGFAGRSAAIHLAKKIHESVIWS